MPLTYLSHSSLAWWQLQNLGSKLIDLWELMDTPLEQQEKFGHVTSSMSCSIDEVSMPGYLAIEVIEQVHYFLYGVDFVRYIL